MKLRRRIACLAALFAVTWASLWPLVSTAHAWMADVTMPLCHQAGMQVAPDVFVSPGISWNLSKNTQLYAFVQIPVYQSVNGVQS